MINANIQFSCHHLAMSLRMISFNALIPPKNVETQRKEEKEGQKGPVCGIEFVE